MGGIAFLVSVAFIVSTLRSIITSRAEYQPSFLPSEHAVIQSLAAEVELDTFVKQREEVAVIDVDPLGLKPRYHIAPLSGWLNDPNGMFHLNGRFHMFYQFNPKAPVWDAPYWSHVVSTDMVQWERLEDALRPEDEYDIDGCFSGSATITDTGLPVILYTATSKRETMGYHYQVQAAAFPEDPFDPELKKWVKSYKNPLNMAPPPGGDHSQFRDPVTAWKVATSEGERWYTAIGAQANGGGTAALYHSKDLLDWTYAGSLFSQLGLQSQALDVKHCQEALSHVNIGQVGAACHVWECPDFFRLGDVWVFKYSDQVKERNPFAMDWYIVSDEDPDYQAAASKPGVDALPATYQGSPYKERVIDYGAVYASKAFRTEDRRMIWIGWVYEDSKGTVEVNGNGTEFSNQQGWQGLLTLPREMKFDPATKTVTFTPVVETERLHGRSLYSSQQPQVMKVLDSVIVPQGPVAAGQKLQQQMRATLSFNLKPHSIDGHDDHIPFTAGIIIWTGGESKTSVRITGKARVGAAGQMLVENAWLIVDRSLSGGASKNTTQGGPIDIPDGGLPADQLSLDVFIDASAIEAFANAGHGRVTTRIYPDSMPSYSWGISVFGNSASCDVIVDSADVWDMDSCWL